MKLLKRFICFVLLISILTGSAIQVNAASSDNPIWGFCNATFYRQLSRKKDMHEGDIDNYYNAISMAVSLECGKIKLTSNKKISNNVKNKVVKYCNKLVKKEYSDKCHATGSVSKNRKTLIIKLSDYNKAVSTESDSLANLERYIKNGVFEDYTILEIKFAKKYNEQKLAETLAIVSSWIEDSPNDHYLSTAKVTTQNYMVSTDCLRFDIKLTY